MCRRKPGPRCGNHAQTHLASVTDRRDRAQDRLQQLITSKASPRLVELWTEKVERLAERQQQAQTDVDATRAGMDHLTAQLERDDLPVATRAAIERRRDTAQALRVSRRQQVKLMPPLDSDDPDVVHAYNELGRAREQMAYFDAAVVAAGKYPDAVTIGRRSDAEDLALTREIAYRQLVAGGGADPHHLHPAEAASIVTADAEQANRIVYLSHMRAAFTNPLAHPNRLHTAMLGLEAKVAGVVKRDYPKARPAKDRADDDPVTPAAPPKPAARIAAMGHDNRFEGWLMHMGEVRGKKGTKISERMDKLIDEVIGTPQEQKSGITINIPGV